LVDGLDGVLSTYDVADSTGRVVARYEVHDQVCGFPEPVIHASPGKPVHLS